MVQNIQNRSLCGAELVMYLSLQQKTLMKQEAELSKYN